MDMWEAIVKLGSYSPTDYPQVLVPMLKDIPGCQLCIEGWGEGKMCPMTIQLSLPSPLIAQIILAG